MDASLRVMVVDGIRKTVLLFSQSNINDCKWMLGRWIWPVNAFVFRQFVFLFALVFMVVNDWFDRQKKATPGCGVADAELLASKQAGLRVTSAKGR